MTDPLLQQLVDSIFSGVDPRANCGSSIDLDVWANLATTGLDRLIVPAEAGGSGASFNELATVLRGAGAAAVRAPVAEANLASAVLARGGSQPADRPTLSMLGGSRSSPGEDVVLAEVPWARDADVVVWIVPGSGPEAEVFRGNVGASEIEHSHNLAGEPRDRVRFPPSAVQSVGTLPSLLSLQVEAAAARAVLLCGALERVRDLSVSYAQERTQFGRPIGRFQAVQAHLVEIIVAAETTRAIVDRMVAVLCAVTDSSDAAPVVAAARSVAGRSAAISSRCAHQVHGAMGYTVEHPLHAYTTRLLAWRDEDGSQLSWERWLGRHLRELGSDGFWELLTTPTAAPHPG